MKESWSVFHIRFVIGPNLGLCPELLRLAAAGFCMDLCGVDCETKPVEGLGSCLASMTWVREGDNPVGINICERGTLIMAKDVTAVRVGMAMKRYPSYQEDREVADM